MSAGNGHDRECSLEAEENTLGSLLSCPHTWQMVAPLGITASDFHDARHREIFEAIQYLARAGRSHHADDVFSHMDRHEGYLKKLALETLVTADTAIQWATVVKELSDARQDRTERRAQPIDWAAWEGKTPPPREWWIQDWLTPAPTLCSGAGGIGKSLLWQTIGTSLATARGFLAATARPLRVLGWFCEDDENEIVRRQDAICSYFEFSRGDLAGRFYIEARTGYENTLFDLEYGRPVFTPVFRELRDKILDMRIDMLILDNIGQVYGGIENDRHQVTKFVNGVQGMVRDRAFAAVFVGHVARSPGSEFSGNAAWENACRMRWYMGTSLPDQKSDADELEQSGIVYLAKRKANYSEKDYRRLTFEGGLLVPESHHARRFDSGYQNELAEAIVMKGFDKLKAAGIHGTDGKTSGDYLPRQIVEKGFAEGHSRKELAAAMNRLIGAGKLARGVVGTYANRSKRIGLLKRTP